MQNTIKIHSMLAKHWPAVSKIYQQGIATGIATFEKKVPNFDYWDAKHLKTCRLVAILNDKIVGWAALSPVSNRYVYRGVAEVSVYIKNDYRGKKIGQQLLQKLILESEKNELWTLQSSIMPENVASIKLHKKLGFREIGFREKVGQLDGIWKDNVLLEKRSKIIGV